MGTFTPLVSVIIPVYNGRYITEALNSVISQTYKNIEIIVINDGSADNISEIISSFQTIIKISTENNGVASARNEGLKICRGDLVSFIDADDTWSDSKIRRQVDFLLKNREYDLIYGRFRNFFQEGSDPPPIVTREKFLDPDKGKLISLGTLMVRKDVFQKTGLFNVDLNTGEDLDWFIKMRESGTRIYFDDQEVMKRRLHSSNLSYINMSVKPDLLKVLKASLDRKRALGD